MTSEFAPLVIAGLFLVCFAAVQAVPAGRWLAAIAVFGLVVILGGLTRLVMGPGGLDGLTAVAIAIFAMMAGLALIFAAAARLLLLRIEEPRRRRIASLVTGLGCAALYTLLIFFVSSLL